MDVIEASARCSLKEEFPKNRLPLSSGIRLLESRNVRPASAGCDQSLQEQEETGNRTDVIIMMSVNSECSCFEKEGRQKPGVAQNVNFSCIRRRVVAAEGEGHQKQEAQSVNPSFGPIEANYFGEEGHQKSVNSPVESCVWSFKVCMDLDLFPVFPDSLVHPVAKTRSNTCIFVLKLK